MSRQAALDFIAAVSRDPSLYEDVKRLPEGSVVDLCRTAAAAGFEFDECTWRAAVWASGSRRPVSSTLARSFRPWQARSADCGPTIFRSCVLGFSVEPSCPKPSLSRRNSSTAGI